MPYSERAERFMRARAHGWEPDDPKLRRLSPRKAKELLAEAGETTQDQAEALARPRKGGRRKP